MIKIHLSTILGKYRMTQAELARKTGKDLIVEANGNRKMNKK